MAKIIQEIETKVIRTDNEEFRIDSFDIYYSGSDYMGEVEVRLPFPNIMTDKVENTVWDGWVKIINGNRIIYSMRMIPDRETRIKETAKIIFNVQKLILQDLI